MTTSLKPKVVLRRMLARNVVLPFALILIAALCYLPLASKFGFYNDDWYLMYSGTALGSSQFMKVFESDRPFRGYFVGLMFDLFGTNALLYTYSAFLLRVAGAFAFWWALRLSWPRQKMAAWLAALLFVVYPGFLDQPNAIDYQSHQMAFALYMLSIALTVKAVRIERRWAKMALSLLSVIPQVLALLLMEYYIGLEGLRLLLVWVITPGGPGLRSRVNAWLSRAGRAAPVVLPALIGAAGFMVWRMMFFTGTREATDVSGLLGGLPGSPLRLGWMVANMARDLLNVTVLAWAVPGYNLSLNLGLKELILAFVLASTGALITDLVVRARQSATSEPIVLDRAAPRDGLEMIAVGLLSCAIALVPVLVGDRHVIFTDFGRFSLPPAVGAVLTLAGAWQAVLRGRLRSQAAVPALLVSLAVLTHTANSVAAAENWRVMRSFWWQVSWRVPQFEPGTVLMTDYAGLGMAEDYFVWGPANLIYYPGLSDPNQPVLQLHAATLDRSDVQLALDGSVRPFNRRGLEAEVDFKNLLVMTMPDANACMRIFDGGNIEASTKDRGDILLLAPLSDIRRVQVKAEWHTPPESIFGNEPPHDFCYYYQKASLARQRGDWGIVAQLGKEVLALGLSPNSHTEWMPFVQGFAVSGDQEELDLVAARVSGTLSVRRTLCEEVAQGSYGLHEDTPEGLALADAVSCPSLPENERLSMVP